MDLTLQPKPELEIKPADKAFVSRKQYFAKKTFEKIKQYFFSAHLIRQWRPKAESIYPPVPNEDCIQYECDFNRDIQDCFVEDYAEEIFLKNPPPCFVVFGKLGGNVGKLCEEIANEYDSVLLHVDDVVNQVIRSNSDTSKLLDKILRLGLALTLNFILALLSYVAHSPEARHRGYVLYGLPVSPYLHDLTVEDQLNYLFTWENKPTIVINVLDEEEKLIRLRINSRCKIGKLGSEKKSSLRLEKKNPTESDFDDEKNEKSSTNKGEIDINILPSRPWVILPRNEESQVWSELELFDIKIKPAIDLLISRTDPQYVITVDSRLKNEFEIVKARLNLLHIWKSPSAFPFFPLNENENGLKEKNEANEVLEKGEEDKEGEKLGEDDEDSLKKIINVSPNTAFLTLFTKHTISPKYRWELSHYNYICPVSLREGQMIEGKSEFAVVFMKYIYFLRDKESMIKFLKNPRPYVLPIRPKPPARFFIVGYPYSGKTVLAKLLAAEFSIPIINVISLLKKDAESKKLYYQEFCRQKAEKKELIRLTVQAWKDWRVEEDQRVESIDQWMSYIQSLLSRRIEQFYSKAPVGNDSSNEDQTELSSLESTNKSIEISGEENGIGSKRKRKKSIAVSDNKFEDKALEVQGVSIQLSESDPYEREHTPVDDHVTPSEKIIQAMKHEDYEFNENGLEVEANLFFSSLWNSFTGREEGDQSPKKMKLKEESEEEFFYGEHSEEGEREYILPFSKSSEESASVDWCSLLPPQSLSSLMLMKTSHKKREKHKSFKTLLAAASKAYWSPSVLKKEFAKWHIPCYMDIRLCEIFLDNPLLLYKYCPQWLIERPEIPDPVDPMHPSIQEVGRKAYLMASAVTITHDRQEMVSLLRDAIEKAEKDGMRITGEVISPGGWIIDDMVLDQEVWNALAAEKILPDYVYFLIDSDPEHRRIINSWYELHYPPDSEEDYIFDMSSKESEEFGSKDLRQTFSITEDFFSKKINISKHRTEKEKEPKVESAIRKLLNDLTEAVNRGDQELDDIFNSLVSGTAGANEIRIFSTDPFSQSILYGTDKQGVSLKAETSEDNPISFGSASLAGSSHSLFYRAKLSYSVHFLPLGSPLQVVTSKVLNIFKEKYPNKKEQTRYKENFKQKLLFFVSLLTIPQKLEKLKDWLKFLNKGDSIKEIDIKGKTQYDVFSDVIKDLFRHLIKKPRELENFEIEEIKKELKKKSKTNLSDEENKDKTDDNVEEPSESVCIFGESGPLCIVSLERNILLRGKPEFALRYYGKLYFFWDLDAKNKFLEDPEKYAPYYSPIRCLPPMRIFLVGPIGSGKSTLANSISNQCSIHFVDYIKMLNDKLIPHAKFRTEKILPIESQKLLLGNDDNDVAKLLKKKFMEVPYSERQLWLENPYKEDEEQLKVFENFTERVSDSVISIFPELVYRCIESAEEEKSDFMLASKADISVEAPPFLSMNEIKTSLENYFKNKEGLSEYCLNRSINLMWTSFPFITQGFVLDGYPARNFDLESIKQNKMIPDLVVELTLPEEAMIERNINLRLSFWDTKLKQDIVEEKLIEDTLSFIYRNLMAKRRLELIAERKISEVHSEKSHMILDVRNEDLTKNENQNEPEKSSNFKKKKSKVSVGSSDVAHDTKNEKLEQMNTINAEVDEILKQEFPPLVFSPIFETYEAAKARITGDLQENYRRDMAEIEKIKTVFQNLKIPWLQIDSHRDLNDIENELFIRLNEIKKRIGNKGEFAFEMKMDTAEKLLRQGFYFLSKFGKWCPVQVYRMKNPIQMYIPLAKRGKIFPVAYRNYIYFIGGENEKKNFIDNPIKYIFNEPHHPNIPLRVAVIGPPKSGKSTLSQRLGVMFGLKVMTMGSALRFVLEKMRGTELEKSIDGYLRRGCFLPLSLKTEALMACLNDQACVTQGFVFDGIPFDAAMTQSFAENGKLPFVILSLIGDSDFAKANRRKLDVKKFRISYKQKLNFDLNYKEWKKTYKRFAQWNQEAYSNLYEVDAKTNIVEVFYEAYDIIKKCFFGILYYVEYCVTDRVLPLQYLCVSLQEYELRKSNFYNNCPVCWAKLNILTCVSDPPPRTGLVQYLNHFYWVCHKHLEMFIQNPKNCFPPNAPQFPKFLPKLLNRKVFEASSSQLRINGLGRCPVSKVDFPDSFDWEGSWDFAVSYADKVYLCKNQKMLNRFLARPWRYACADTVFELDRSTKSDAIQQLGPPKLTALPAIGFLEQTVANLIVDALQVLGSVRPLYPNLTPTCMGCTFLGIYLKVYNKRNKSPGIEIDYLNILEKHCKATRYKLPAFKRTVQEEGFSDFNQCSSESNDTESIEGESVGPLNLIKSSRKKSESEESAWLDFEAQADKKLWSAKHQNLKFTEMIMTANNELHEIQELPKQYVILRYQTYCLRSQPLPPISNCVTHIYHVRPNLTLPKKFNIDSLYQAVTYFPSPFPPEVTFNPEKGTPSLLYSEKRPRHLSEFNIYQGKRVISDSLLDEPKEFVKKSITPDENYMWKHFIPRFHVLDMVSPVDVPVFPKVVESKPIVYNPHRDYTYTLLMSDFFHTTHVLRCYEWMECMHQLEFSTLLNRNLSVNNAPSQFFFRPRVTHSMQTIQSKGSFVEIPFYVRDEALKPDIDYNASMIKEDDSWLNFIEMIIMEKLDQLFYRLSVSEFSYDSFEAHITNSDSNISMKPVIFYREILPYPPLIWDILSTPYYALRTIPSIFEIPCLDNIAHARHVSLLDGIIEPNDQFRFVRYPTWVHAKADSLSTSKSELPKKNKKEIAIPSHFFVYDFFGLQWTAFLTYPYSWTYNLDLRDNFVGEEDNTEPLIPDDESHDIVG